MRSSRLSLVQSKNIVLPGEASSPDDVILDGISPGENQKALAGRIVLCQGGVAVLFL
jgi:hypothetical protein